ncbi:hypothetical protein BMS3Bbin06_02181 [bacterium BMS3Bbin06]|nr:hypothetical protein BMS3Abin08_02227 [bacterium BMS3Abin08]GBE35638.1 hypothetical protein BMS3Bbin06_02181 [bacterium BMS3Bbin06]HDO34821.1 hypothetical protein [Nitrospirota bacterium]
MLRRVMISLLFLFVFSGLAYAEDISLTIPCDGGGSVDVDGTYTPLTGAYNFTFTFNSCVLGKGGTASGTLSSSGTIIFTSASIANVDITTSSDMTVTEADGNALTGGCNNHLWGTYDFDTMVFNGNVSTSCNGSGKIIIDLMNLLYGADQLLY